MIFVSCISVKTKLRDLGNKYHKLINNERNLFNVNIFSLIIKLLEKQKSAFFTCLSIFAI